MVPSVAGLLVFLAIFAVSQRLGSALLIGLLASLPFGSTAFATLTAVGGSTPLIYSLFAALLLLNVAMRREARSGLAKLFTLVGASWVVLLLGIYACLSAFLLPRLLQGRTTAFVAFEGNVTELPLNPVSGNITQTAYFTLGLLCFFALLVVFLERQKLEHVRRGLFIFVVVNIVLGLVDLLGKSAGLGDLMAPIRTVGYSLLVEVEAIGFWRIAGGYAEASAYAGASLTGFAFTYTYWRHSHNSGALLLAAVQLMLILLSTSSTAYAGLALLALAPASTIAYNLLRGRVNRQDMQVMLLGLLLLFVLLALFLARESLFQPVINLFDSAIVNKMSSDSGTERMYWNLRSVEQFVESGFLGIGMGSSRSSSWIISVLSQLGIIGTTCILILVAIIMRGMANLQPASATASLFTLAAAARAAAVAGLISGCIAGSSADPGVLFFVVLATILACRHHVERYNLQQQLRRSWPLAATGRPAAVPAG